MRSLPKTAIDPNELEFKKISIEAFPDLKSFRCGNGSMDSFLEIEAFFSDIERKASTSLVYHGSNLVAYYTLQHTKLDIESWKNDSEYAFSLDIARLAVASSYQGKGIGSYIMWKIINTAYEVNERFITVDALKEKWEWYSKFDFEIMFEDDLQTDSPVVSMYADLYDENLVRYLYEE